MQTIDFFHTLYGKNFPGWLVFFNKELKRSCCLEARELSGLIDPDSKEDEFSENIYFGVCLQNNRVPPYMRGRAATTIAMPGVWLDIDFKKDNGKNYPPNMDAALNLLGKFPLEPSIIVHSGNGLHVYWLFNELWVFSGSEDRLRAQTLLRRFNQHFKNIFQKHGYHLDSTSDLARVLRVPGTINTKWGTLVQVIHDSGLRYQVEEISALLPPTTTDGSKAPVNLPPGNAHTILEKCAFIRHCRDDAATLSEPEWYAMLTIIGRCENGRKICHLFSSPYPRYTREETDKKLDHALKDTGPYTCQYIRENITDEFCRECRENVKSPIVLGISAPQQRQHNLKLYRLTEIERVNAEFLIYPFLPRGEITVVDGDPGVGKAVAVDTLIPTPNGFKKMEDIKVGDVVYDGDGHETVVTYVSPVYYNHKCYRVVLDDGTKITADAEHLWLVQTAKQRTNTRRWRSCPKKEAPNKKPGYSILTTEEIAHSIKVENGKKSNYSIDISPFDGRYMELPIPPYTLGAWLGDGTAREAEITTMDEEILNYIREEGVSVSRPYLNRTGQGKARTYRIGGVQSRNDNSSGRFTGIVNNSTLVYKLKQLNLLNNKHIPEEYLFASFEQRLALLQGLMDTDGYVQKNKSCEFTTTNERLAKDVSTLLAGLGIKNTVNVKQVKLNGTTHYAYRVLFRTDLPVFRLTRKRNRLPKKVSSRVKRRYIVSVEEVPSVPVKCIMVASPKHTYMCTRNFVETHNSWVWMALAAGLTGSRVCKIPYDHTASTDNKILILTTEDSIPKTVRSRLEDLGADLEKIFIFVGPEGETATATHLDDLKPHIEQIHPDLIIVDPVTLYATTEKDYDSDKAVSVRKMLNKLLELTRQLNCATIVCRHLRKEGGKAIYRGLGSIDFIGTARSGLLVTRDTKDPTRCLVSHYKSNLAQRMQEALIYTLDEHDTPPFKWQGTCEADPDELAEQKPNQGSTIEKAREFLQNWLADGPVPAGEVIKAALEAGISERTLRRAHKSLGIKSTKSGKTWVWHLPENN